MKTAKIEVPKRGETVKLIGPDVHCYICDEKAVGIKGFWSTQQSQIIPACRRHADLVFGESP